MYQLVPTMRCTVYCNVILCRGSCVAIYVDMAQLNSASSNIDDELFSTSLRICLLYLCRSLFEAFPRSLANSSVSEKTRRRSLYPIRTNL